MARPVSSFQHLRIIKEFGGVGLVVVGGGVGGGTHLDRRGSENIPGGITIRND